MTDRSTQALKRALERFESSHWREQEGLALARTVARVLAHRAHQSLDAFVMDARGASPGGEWARGLLQGLKEVAVIAAGRVGAEAEVVNLVATARSAPWREVLEALSEPQRICTLEPLLKRSRSSLRETLARLEELGLAQRMRGDDGVDGRAVWYQLTWRGSAVLEQLATKAPAAVDGAPPSMPIALLAAPPSLVSSMPTPRPAPVMRARPRLQPAVRSAGGRA